MKSIYYNILAATALIFAVASCTNGADEPSSQLWELGKAPISLRTVAPVMSRASIDPTVYDIYTCGVYYNGLIDNCYYTTVEEREGEGRTGPVKYSSQFSKMSYLTYDSGSHLFYLPTDYFPLDGNMDMFSFGLPTGKMLSASCYPAHLDPEATAEYMTLNLIKEHSLTEQFHPVIGDYDGSYPVFVADRITQVCTPNLMVQHTQFAYYHYIQAHLTFKFVWDDAVAATDGIINRLHINSVTIENTPVQGLCDVAHNVADHVWHDVIVASPEVPKFTGNKLISYANGLTIANGIYIIPKESRQRFIINYSIANGDQTDANKRTMNYIVADDPGEAWLAGHCYNYTIKIGAAGEFKIATVGVTDFDIKHTDTTVIE